MEINMNKSNPDIKDVLKEKNTTIRNEIYNDYVKSVTPKHNLAKNVIHAFIIGGIICTIGQLFTNLYMYMGLDEETAGMFNILSLILLSAIFTGTGHYARLVKYAGAGAIVPITGFANSVVAPAVEYKNEGNVFGIGCKIFTIAGPVILYGIFSSWIFGLIYWIWRCIYG